MEEKIYPIYKFYAKWNQDNFQVNGTVISIMYKEEPTEEQLNNDLEKFKFNLEQKQIDKKHPITEWLEINYKYYEHEVWMLGWFNHMTYNQFKTDEEVECSFFNFIDRKMLQNIKNGHGETEQNMNNKNTFYCFMGAEDRWRWKICRCEDCRRLGKITIDH